MGNVIRGKGRHFAFDEIPFAAGTGIGSQSLSHQESVQKIQQQDRSAGAEQADLETGAPKGIAMALAPARHVVTHLNAAADAGAEDHAERTSVSFRAPSTGQ